MSDRTQHYIRKLGVLRSDRGNFNTQWEEAAERIIPAHRSTFTGNTSVETFTPGQKKTELQYDSTAAIGCQRFAAVIESLATPQGNTWHRLIPADKTIKRNRRAREFFDDLNEVLFGYRMRPVANFVGNSQQAYTGLGAYGNGILFIDAPERTRGLRYRNIHLGEAYFLENHAGVVDTLYRAFAMTARQIVQKWGMAAPEEIHQFAQDENRATQRFEVLHVVEPRENAVPGRVGSLDMPWVSLYILTQKQHLLQEGGYNSFPYAIARYSQVPGEVYGRGPAQMVLPAIKVLNDQKRTMLVQGHRAVDPILLVHDDGILGGNFKTRAGKTVSGAVNADGRPLVHTLPVGRIDVGDKMMEMERATINDAFLITLFQILTENPQMTATEVLERTREKGMLIAPTAGRLQAEFLGGLIERELDVLGQQGLLPELPPILRGSPEALEYKIEYDSPMARMQRAEKAAGFMRALQEAQEYARLTGDVEPLDFFNFDRAMPEVIDIHGAPVSWTRTPDEVAARREARAQQVQQQQMIEAAPAMAALAKNVKPGQGGTQ